MNTEQHTTKLQQAVWEGGRTNHIVDMAGFMETLANQPMVTFRDSLDLVTYDSVSQKLTMVAPWKV